MDLAVQAAVLRDSHALGQLHVMQPGRGRQMSQENMSRKLILKLIIYFTVRFTTSY